MRFSLIRNLIIFILPIFSLNCSGGSGEDGDDVQVPPEPAFFNEPDPEKILFDGDGSVYPINEVIIDLIDNASRDDAEEIASLVDGMIVGFVPSINVYQVEVLSSTKEGLDSIIEELRGDPRVEGVLKNFFLELFSVNTDLCNLRRCQPNNFKAYEKIRIQDAYDLIDELNPKLHAVSIGVADTGIDKSHPEFDGVKIEAPSDILGHGTWVSGIIGANNLSLATCSPPDFFQMNGIIAGVPGIDYSLITEEADGIVANILSLVSLDRALAGSIMSVAASIDNLASKGVQIINISIGGGRCAVDFFGCIPHPLVSRANSLLKYLLNTP